LGDRVHIILIGAPGAGKGTQAQALVDEFGLAHIASGDMFRDAMARGTPLGLRAKAFVEKGELVPDEVTVGMVMERMSRPDVTAGVLLDGFPRNLAQAEALERALQTGGDRIDQALYLAVAEDELVRRLSGRWLCRSCQTSYHEVFSPPQVGDRCDRCGGELYQRPDDTSETVRNRLNVYFEQTAPLVDHYRAQGVLDEVNGGQPIAEVRQAMLDAVRRRLPKI
jgi:adenylate kinase